MTEPTTAIEAYKAIIDGLVNQVRTSGSGPSVAEDLVFSNAPKHSHFNNFIRKLPPGDRALLSEMLQEERDSAIHDVLAEMTWWINARDVGLTFHGKPMPVDLSGMGLHGDYVGRREGWQWPSE